KSPMGPMLHAGTRASLHAWVGDSRARNAAARPMFFVRLTCYLPTPPFSRADCASAQLAARATRFRHLKTAEAIHFQKSEVRGQRSEVRPVRCTRLHLPPPAQH